MDNQQDQTGASTPSTPGRSTPNSAMTGAGHKSTPTASTPNAGSGAGAVYSSADGARQPEDQHTNASEGNLLDTALNSGKKWIEDSGVLDKANQLPQSLKDLGNRAVARVSDLTTTQKVVGGALLAVGLGWLATRKGKDGNSPYNYGNSRSNDGSYGRRSYGYQAPDASSAARRPVAGSGRPDSGSAYGNGGNRYGSAGIFSGGKDDATGTASAPAGDYGSRTSESSGKSDGFRSVE